MKICPRCHRELPATNEYFCRDVSHKDRLYYRCKKCCVEGGKESNKKHPNTRKKWYKENYERRKKYHKKYRDEHPATYRANNLKRYSITVEQYDEMFAAQGGVCAICDKPEVGKNKWGVRRLAVDHDHVTGKVRGLLCVKCNVLIGLAKDNIAILSNAKIYLEKTRFCT